MEDIKNTALGATNTESGKSNKSEPSVSELMEKVKSAQAEDPFPLGAPLVKEPTPPLDLRTEMFMLSEFMKALDNQYSVDSRTKYDILSAMISKCAGANETC